MSNPWADPVMIVDSSLDAASEPSASAPGRPILRNTVVIGLSTVAAKGLMFLWQLLLARSLGAEGYGIYGTIGALLAVGATIPDLGMGLIVIREVARRPEDAGRYLGVTLSLQPVLAVLGYAILILGAFLLGYDVRLRWLLLFVGVNLLVDVIGNMCHNQLIAVERMTALALISVIHVGLIMIFAGAALAANGGLWEVYAGIFVAGAVRSAAYWIALRRTGCRPVLPAQRGLVRGLILSGLPLALTGFLSLATMHADKLMTTALVGAERTGYLTAAFVIVFGIVELINTTMLIVTFPALSRAQAAGQSGMFGKLVEKLTFFNLLLSFPLAVYLSVLAVPLSGLLFGQGFTHTGEVLSVLIWYAVVAMVTNVFAQALVAQNRQRRLMWARAIGLAVNIALGLILIPARGAPGAAAAALTAEALVLIELIVSVPLPTGWWEALGGQLWRLGAASIALAACMLLLRGSSPLLAAVLGLPAYAALVWLSGAMGREDWRLLRQLVAAVPGAAAVGRFWVRLAV